MADGDRYLNGLQIIKKLGDANNKNAIGIGNNKSEYVALKEIPEVLKSTKEIFYFIII